ncbi:MAG: hypothetical protein RLP02_09560 [Coleofasciculus sp. C2-GNP5-27]
MRRVSRLLNKGAIAITGVALLVVAIPVQAAETLSTLWTVYEISFKPPCNPEAPPRDYPGTGSR